MGGASAGPIEPPAAAIAAAALPLPGAGTVVWPWVLARRAAPAPAPGERPVGLPPPGEAEATPAWRSLQPWCCWWLWQWLKSLLLGAFAQAGAPAWPAELLTHAARRCGRSMVPPPGRWPSACRPAPRGDERALLHSRSYIQPPRGLGRLLQKLPPCRKHGCGAGRRRHHAPRRRASGVVATQGCPVDVISVQMRVLLPPDGWWCRDQRRWIGRRRPQRAALDPVTPWQCV